MMKPKAADSQTTATIETYFSPRLSIEKGTMTRTKKAQAEMAGKQAKTTQKPVDMTPLWHKSPMTATNPPPLTKTTNMTALMQKASQGMQATKNMTQINGDDKEMTDDASTVTRHITNVSTTTNMTQQKVKAKQQPNKTIFNPWKTVAAGQATNNNQGTTIGSTKPPLKSCCWIKWWNQAMGKGAKGVHRQKILNVFKQIQKIDRTMTVYHFYSTNKNAPTQSYPPLNGKIKLPPDPAGMCQYCLGQPPLEQPGYTSI